MLEQGLSSPSIKEPEVEPFSPSPVAIPGKMRKQLSSPYPKHQGSSEIFSDQTRDRMNSILMRARRPVYSQIYRTCQLNFEGRVTKSSRKNIQLEYKSRQDEKCRVVLQHGSQNKNSDSKGKSDMKIYTLDFTYPCSTVTAFGFALGLYHYKNEDKDLIPKAFQF